MVECRAAANGGGGDLGKGRGARRGREARSRCRPTTNGGTVVDVRPADHYGVVVREVFMIGSAAAADGCSFLFPGTDDLEKQ